MQRLLGNVYTKSESDSRYAVKDEQVGIARVRLNPVQLYRVSGNIDTRVNYQQVQ